MKAIHITTILLLSVIVIIESVIIWNDNNSQKVLAQPTKLTPSLIGKSDTIRREDFVLPKGAQHKLYLPKKGVIPDAETAVKIAEAAWLPVFGEKIYNEKPFNVTLMDDTLWLVGGTVPEESLGGSVYIVLQKKDGKIIDMGWNK